MGRPAGQTAAGGFDGGAVGFGKAETPCGPYACGLQGAAGRKCRPLSSCILPYGGAECKKGSAPSRRTAFLVWKLYQRKANLAKGSAGGKAGHDDNNDADGSQVLHQEAVCLLQTEGLAVQLDLADGVLGLPGPANKEAGTQCTHRDHQTVGEELHKVAEDGGRKTILEVEPDTLDIKGGLRAGINGTKEEHHHAQNDGSGGAFPSKALSSEGNNALH